MNKVVTIYVEGNVGAGKSTLLTFIKKQFDVDVIYEPHELWQDVDGHNLLEHFFLDQPRWAFTLQRYVNATRLDELQSLQEKNSAKVTIIERSLFSGRYCVAKNLYEIGALSDLEWAVYKKLWQRDTQQLPLEPTGFIYLRIPAAICHQRIAHRNRFEEKPIMLQYLEQLEQQHDNWLLHKKIDDIVIKNAPVLVLDNLENITTDRDLQHEYHQKIKQFIQQITM